MKILKESGRSTGCGAYTEAKVYALDGSEVDSNRESSRSGNHWEDTFELEEGCAFLVLVTDASNSGKNNSYARIEGEGTLSEIQLELKKDFERKHRTRDKEVRKDE